ncbi:uncharacterized protein LOC123683320 [Harmonia axyridis]|uniref:uncharacterized protein LOC123683320 n=1 Tax=Harmonia axyridis TaxID=115357 RepID=UPI001E278E4A|nr:uncharacterized protein LOC123683320 [Harmonia axyridis]
MRSFMDGNEVGSNPEVIRRRSMVKNHRKITLDHFNYLKIWEQMLNTQRKVVTGQHFEIIESTIIEEKDKTSNYGKEHKNNKILVVEPRITTSKINSTKQSTKPRIVGVVYKFPSQYQKDVLDIVIGRRWHDN